MKPYNNFSLVIQGPLHKNSIRGVLENYSKYTDNIIISHWDTDDESLLKSIEGIPHKIIKNTFHKNINAYNNQNVYYQLYTSLNGVAHVSTDFTIKLRSDQWYGNLIPFFEQVIKEPDKYTCANLHFRPDYLYKYHPSDKLIGGSTNIIRSTFYHAMKRIVDNALAMMAGAYMYSDYLNDDELFLDFKQYDHSVPGRPIFTSYPQEPLIGTIQVLPAGYVGLVPEMIIGTSFLIAKGIYPCPKKSIEIVKDNFRIVRVEDMLPYINKDGTSKIEHNSAEIHRIEDYG